MNYCRLITASCRRINRQRLDISNDVMRKYVVLPAKPQTINCSNTKHNDTETVANIKNASVTITPDVTPLIDTFGRNHTYLRISLSERCNLRCKYCMPEEGVQLQPKVNLLTTDEIIRLASIFVELGVRKIRLTGGEPTVRPDVIEIIGKLKEISQLETVGITTNGLMLTRFLVDMQRAGLDSLNISLDTLRMNRFEEITRRKGWKRVLAGIDLAIQLGYKPKINCVLIRNFNEDEICDFVEFTRHRNVDVRFIEYMPFTGNKWETGKLISFRDTLNIIQNNWPQLKRLNNDLHDTSKSYKVPGFQGQVGFITSMTEHFCSSCNRLRLTSDGNLKVCLFGNKEISLRDAIRNHFSKQDVIDLISVAVKKKKRQHAGMMNLSKMENRPMILIGDKRKLKQSYGHMLLTSIIQTLNVTNNYDTFYVKFLSSSIRRYSTDSNGLTHVDNIKGYAIMVDISSKDSTIREATAQANVYVGKKIAHLIQDNNMKKGDVLGLARLSGIIAAKRTSDLIPLCHNIMLSHVEVIASLDMNTYVVYLKSTVRCCGQTGVEMEALTAVSVAALTVYDMCKAISHDIIISNIQLIAKSGGTGYNFNRN